jgi:DNA-binding MarR family transcriptional regulator
LHGEEKELKNQESIDAIVGSIRRIIRAVSIDYAKTGRRFSLTGPQSAVLRCLAGNGQISAAQVSREVYMSPSSLTGIIDRLAAKRLVERVQHPDDRRVYRLQLTGAGKALCKNLPDPVELRLASRLRKIGLGQVDEIRTSLKKLIQLMDAQHMDDSPLR